MIRVVLPAHLRTIAGTGAEVWLDVSAPITQRSVLDALEALYPKLAGTIREHGTLKRRPLVRFFACEDDLSHDDPDKPLPHAVAKGIEPFFIIGAIAGGSDRIAARVCALEEIQKLREIYRQEMHCQVIHDSLHIRPGWTIEYLLTVDGAPEGYGSVAISGPWKDKPTIYEFFVLPSHRMRMFELFNAFAIASGTKQIETQTNDFMLGVLVQAVCLTAVAESILYEDQFTTSLTIPGATVRAVTLDDAAQIAAMNLDDGAKYGVDLNGSIVGTGDILYHYNRPYGDIFMSIAESNRRSGLGAFLVQELKRICYEGGSIPAARCNPTNIASRSTLQKAGFVPCGTIVTGTIVVPM